MGLWPGQQVQRGIGGARGFAVGPGGPLHAVQGEPGQPHVLRSPWRVRASLKPGEQGVCQEVHILTWRLGSASAQL